MREPIPPTAYGARNIDHNELFISILKLQCDKVFITHLKPTFRDHMNPTPTGFVPRWNKDVPDMVGKTWTIFESDSKKAQWNGIPEMQKREI